MNASKSQLEALDTRIQSIDQLGQKTQLEITEGEAQTAKQEAAITRSRAGA